MHIRAHGSLFDDGCLYRLAEEGERGGDSDCTSCRVLPRYLLEVCCRVLIGSCTRERERERWMSLGER